MNFLNTQHGALHYRAIDIDSGKPVLAFINSLGTDFRAFDDVVEILRADFALLLHDKRGHGLSSLGTPPYKISDFSDDLSLLATHLGIQKLHVLGLSIGGLIALDLYRKRPDLVQSLILSNTAPKIGQADMWNTRIAAIEQNGIASLTGPIMERWFTPSFRTDENAVYHGAIAMLERQSVAGYCGASAAIRDADLTEIARSIKCKTLCIAGDQDGSTPPDLVKAMAEIIPGSDFHLIENCAHLPPFEQPQAYASRILAFLKN